MEHSLSLLLHENEFGRDTLLKAFREEMIHRSPKLLSERDFSLGSLKILLAQARANVVSCRALPLHLQAKNISSNEKADQVREWINASQFKSVLGAQKAKGALRAEIKAFKAN